MSQITSGYLLQGKYHIKDDSPHCRTGHFCLTINHALQKAQHDELASSQKMIRQLLILKYYVIHCYSMLLYVIVISLLWYCHIVVI